MDEFVVLDEVQVGSQAAVRIWTDLVVTRLHLSSAGLWPLSGAALCFDAGTRRVLLRGPRADEDLRDQAESVLLGLP